MRLRIPSRPWIVVGTLALLLVLDIGRSIFARVGYADWSEYWRPDPRTYADITWPPGADVRVPEQTGQRVYARYCATCHGPDGRGNGPAAPSMIPRPRDFTRGQFKYKSTGTGQAPTDADLTHVISDGLPGSAMPYFRDLLSQDEIRQVVAYIKNMSGAFAGVAARPL